MIDVKSNHFFLNIGKCHEDLDPHIALINTMLAKQQNSILIEIILF